LAVLGFVFLMTATGILEGTVVGWFEWRVLRRLFAEISLRAWWVITLLGALTAWFFGSLPSSLMGMGSEEVGTAPVEPPLVLIILLACGMGLILGLILA
jgi:predicted alpha/beta hydrolase